MLTAIITSGDMEKEYLAVVEGCPQLSQDRLFDLLYHDQAKNKTYVVKRPRRGVRDASLSYEVMQQDDETALLHIWLHTGRTHQIRVHMSSLGHPVLGDEVYGGDKCRAAKEHVKYISGQCLHAYRLELDHPRTGQRMSFEAPLPAEMLRLIEIFRQEQ